MHLHKPLAVMAAGIVLGQCTGCSDRPDGAGAARAVAAAEPTPEEPNDLTYAGIIAYLEGKGRVIGEAKETYAAAMGAEQGWRVEVDQHPFEIYVFDVQSEEGRLAFESVRTKGVMGFPAETYGNLAFFRSTKDPHPEFMLIVQSIRQMPGAS